MAEQLERTEDPKKEVPKRIGLEEGTFVVETILNHRNYKGRRQYLIRWAGFSPEHDTWESVNNLNCPKLLAEYYQKIGLPVPEPGEGSPRKRIKTEHPTATPTGSQNPMNQAIPKGFNLHHRVQLQEGKINTFIRTEKRLHLEIVSQLKTDRGQQSRIYEYVHCLGNEQNFKEIQQQNKKVVTDAKIGGDYSFFSKLFSDWNAIVRKGPFTIDPAVGAFFMVHNLGPYRVTKLITSTHCHGCGSLIEKSEFTFYHSHLSKDWLDRQFCYPCLKYILYHLQALGLTPLKNDQRPILKRIYSQKMEPKMSLQNL